MQQLTLEPEEFIEQLPPNTKVAVEALMTLQSEVSSRWCVIQQHSTKQQGFFVSSSSRWPAAGG